MAPAAYESNGQVPFMGNDSSHCFSRCSDHCADLSSIKIESNGGEAQMGEKILFIGDYFGEFALPNGICVHQVAKELQKRGCDVSVLAINDGYQKPEEVYDGLRVVRVRADATTRLTAWYRQHPGKLESIWFKFGIFLKDVRTFFSLWLWPFNAPINLWLTYHAAKKMIETDHIDTVVCTYTPFNAVLVGHILKRKKPSLKYIVYFLDSLSGGIFPKLTSQEWVAKQGKKWERMLLKNADGIYIMKAHQKHHQEHSCDEPYYSRIRVLDIPLLKMENIKQQADIGCLPKDKINLVYLGSLKKNLKNPEPFLKAFLAANLQNVAISFIGDANDCEDLLCQAQKAAPKQIHIIKSVPHSEVEKILAQADALLNIGSANTCQIPCKIFEYMSTGKPIITTYKTPNEPSLPYLREYAGALLLDESVSSVENAQKLKEFTSSLPKQIETDALKEKYYLCTPSAFCDALQEDTAQ